jgi:hypothetical protein
MPLNSSSLEKGLVTLMTSKPSTAGESAKRIAKLYAAYTATAVAGPTKPIFTGSEATVMEAALLGAFANTTGIPLAAAQAFGQGFLAFWMSPPVAFAGGGTGVPIFVPAPMLVSQLMTAFPAPGGTETLSANKLATCLDTATRAILVAVTIPPAPPVPMPLT